MSKASKYVRKALILLLIAALALLLGGCGYWAVEEAPVQVGVPVICATPGS